MAWLRKIIGKREFLLITAIWNALASYVPLQFNWSPETVTLFLVVGNAIIAYLAIEKEAK